MRVITIVIGCWVLFAAGAFVSPSDANATVSEGALGIYVYENIEGFHQGSSASGTELSRILLTVFDQVVSFDRIPLESNESVRILEEMTEDRKVVVTTAISTWLVGGAIAVPTLTFKDDAIKFRDLTWHVNRDSVLAHAKVQGLDYVLIGTISGLVNPVKSADSGGRKLLSVQAVANLQLLDLQEGGLIWAENYRETQAGFDARSVFAELVVGIGEQAGKVIKEQFVEQVGE